MHFNKFTFLALATAILAGAATARTQASESNQPSSASPAPQANPAPPTQQTQPSGELKPGQGATPDQHPSPLPESNPSSPQVNAPTTSGGTEATAPKPEIKKKKKAGRKTAGKPRRRVVKDGGADETEVQISEGLPNDLAAHQRASTNTLLSSTEDNLKTISNRHLTADQQGTVEQIRLYMQQSRDAIQKSDVDRAHTLALKAHLLSDSLVKQ
jgi:hypothetical protein